MAVALVLTLASMLAERPAFAPLPAPELDKIYHLTITQSNPTGYNSNQTTTIQYNIRYSIDGGGILTNLQLDPPSKSVVLVIKSAEANNGSVAIELPRTLIDAKNPRHATPDCWVTGEYGKIYNYCDYDLDLVITETRTDALGHDLGNVTLSSSSFTAPDSRTLEFEYQGAETARISIQGTYLVPEFGQFQTGLTTAACLATAVVITYAMRRWTQIHVKKYVSDLHGL